MSGDTRASKDAEWIGMIEGADGYAAPARVISGAHGLTFVEETDTGNVMTTSIFPGAKSIDGRLAAVHSRHSAMTDKDLMPSQYLGACIIAK